jgi:DNA-directed RNA polymerase subunit RPC12/RpoP
MPKVVYICIDCGKKSTPKYSTQMRISTEYRCFTCAQKHRRSDPKDIERTCLAQRKRYQDPEKRKAHKKIYEDPEVIERIRVGMVKYYEDPFNRSQTSISTKKAMGDPVVKERIRVGIERAWKDPIRKEIHSNGQRKRFEREEERTRSKGRQKSRWEDPMFVESVLIGIHNQGFWYGHPTLQKTNSIYCDLWNDINERVHAFYDYKCVLCGEPENGRSHIGHHVFYVKEACCWYDENGIYYTNLNAKNHPAKDYCIGTNPNYFVILCRSCHSKTNGNFENRKKYADLFKNMIDTYYEGKCYLTKEEMLALHA